MVLYVAVTKESSALARRTPVQKCYKRYYPKIRFNRVLPKIVIVMVNPTEDEGLRSLRAMSESLGSGIWFSEPSNGLLSSPYSSIECICEQDQSNGKKVSMRGDIPTRFDVEKNYLSKQSRFWCSLPVPLAVRKTESCSSKKTMDPQPG